MLENIYNQTDLLFGALTPHTNVNSRSISLLKNLTQVMEKLAKTRVFISIAEE